MKDWLNELLTSSGRPEERSQHPQYPHMAICLLPLLLRAQSKIKYTKVGICIGAMAQKAGDMLWYAAFLMPPKRYFILIPGIYKWDEISLTHSIV